MIVVADTGPLNYLIQLQLDTVLQELYARVLVPRGVLREMTRAKAPVAVRGWASSPPSWVEVLDVMKVESMLNPELGAGEREAISLAIALGADTILLDDLAAREEASSRNLVVAGTIAVLIEGALRHRCDLPESLAALRRLGFRMSTKLETGAVERLKERQATMTRRGR